MGNKTISILILAAGLSLAGCATTQQEKMSSTDSRAEQLARIQADRDEAWQAEHHVQARSGFGERAVRKSDQRAGSQ